MEGGPGEEGAELVHRGVEVEEKTPGASRHCYISAALKHTETHIHVYKYRELHRNINT